MSTDILLFLSSVFSLQASFNFLVRFICRSSFLSFFKEAMWMELFSNWFWQPIDYGYIGRRSNDLFMFFVFLGSGSLSYRCSSTPKEGQNLCWHSSSRCWYSGQLWDKFTKTLMEVMNWEPIPCLVHICIQPQLSTGGIMYHWVKFIPDNRTLSVNRGRFYFPRRQYL